MTERYKKLLESIIQLAEQAKDGNTQPERDVSVVLYTLAGTMASPRFLPGFSKLCGEAAEFILQRMHANDN